MIFWIRVLGAVIDGNKIYDFYQTGQEAIINSQPNKFKGQKITNIEVHHESYTTSAIVWFEDCFHYTENVEGYYGKRDAQGEAPDVQER